jgi:hypothetical protein
MDWNDSTLEIFDRLLYKFLEIYLFVRSLYKKLEFEKSLRFWDRGP